MHKIAKTATLGTAFFLVFGVSGVLAQNQGSGLDINTDVDSLFGGDEIIESPTQGPAPSTDPLASSLKTVMTRIGGSFSGSLTPMLAWNKLWDGSSDILNPETRSLSSSLKSTIFFDARPKDDFRVYGSFKTSWPFSTDKTFLTGAAFIPGSTPAASTLLTTSSSISVPNIKVFELFADFNYKDRIFFRFGKSTVKWGVGYFWSPADVINLETINVLDAEAQREGPVNFRVHIPILGTQNNFYFYTILDNNNVEFETTALAARAEFLLGSYELGLGAYYRYDTAERVMATVSGPLGDLDIFSEAMASRGSSKTFVTSIVTSSPFVTNSTASQHRDSFYFSASAGALYSSPKDNITAIAQYYYNGEGYSDSSRTTLVADANAVLVAVASSPTNYAKVSQALAGLIYGSGQHYAALSFSKSKLIGDDVSASVIAVANLSDGSGIVKPNISWAPLDYLTLSLSPLFVFGPTDGEYTFLAGGDKATLSLGLVVSGSF
ncbi:MAG: hypothetical protein NT061_00130 [Spirochaetes bacterium]|nr:hypothetical protein [Spirochaetota bacterium]